MRIVKLLSVTCFFLCLSVRAEDFKNAQRRDPKRVVKIAVLQAGTAHSRKGNPGLGANFDLFAGLARRAAAEKPDIIVFPEYAITGWPYPPESVMNGVAETIPGDGRWFRRYVALARELRTAILGWLVERGEGKLYNAAFLLDEKGRLRGKYRKVHANLGEQTWWGWSKGRSFEPIEYEGVKYGVSICADMWFPETVRCEELLGADVVIHLSIADDMGHLIPARAFDSRIPIVAAIFNGGSYAVDGKGKLLGKLPAKTAQFKVFSIRPFVRHLGFKYGGIWDIKAGGLNLRNVRAYSILVDPSTRPPWTQVFFDRRGRPQSRKQLMARFHGRYDADDPEAYHQKLVTFAPPWTSPFKVDPAWRYHLVNREGTHLFILNKTAWMYFGCKDPLNTLKRAKALGANVIRTALEGTYYFKDLGLDLWPWGGTRSDPKWTEFNEEYWDRVEERIRLAGEHGIGLDLVLYCTLHPTEKEKDRQRPYWQEIIRRLSKYANILTWEIANEYTGNPAFQAAAARFLKSHDPYHRPVCTSAGTTDGAVWPEAEWLDLAINHSCTSSGPRHDLRNWYLAVARNTRSHGKPAWCNESGRERRHGNDDGIHRRKQGWLWCSAGCFWTWHSWDGCEGIDDRKYKAPGEEFVKPMADFFRSLPFWTLAPNETSFRVLNPAGSAGDASHVIYTALADSDRSLIVAYLCVRKSGGRAEGVRATVGLSVGRYRVTFLRPQDLKVVESRTINRAHPGREELVLPAFVDDLAVKIERFK